MNAVVVYNSKAGGALSATALRTLCDTHGIVVDTFIPVNNDLHRTLAPFIKKDATIMVVGGDGTLSSLAGLIAGTGAVLAPLPGGTLNHFTKDLGIPQDVGTAIARLARAKVRMIDVAEVNGRIFINNSSIGLYPSSLRMRDRFERYVGKWVAAVVASVRALVYLRTYDVTIDNETFQTPFIFVGNNVYSFDRPGNVTRTALNEGVLLVFIARTTSRFVLFKMVLHVLANRAHLVDEFDERKTRELRIVTRKKRLSVSRDGEVTHMTSPLVYAIRSRDLRILY